MRAQRNIGIIAGLLIAVCLLLLAIDRPAVAITPSPVLISPADAAALPRNSIKFDWEDVVGADRYCIELLNALPEKQNDNTASMHRVTAAQCPDSASEFPGDTSYLPPGTYYWRAIAVKNNTLYGGFSDARSFSIPAWPEPNLTLPIDDYAQPAHGPLEFNWDDMAGATGYGIELLSVAPENRGGMTASKNRLTAALSPGGFSKYPGDTSGLLPGTYWWRVIGFRNGVIYGVFSEARSFTVPAWAGVTLTTSYNGVGLDSPYAGFSWAPVPGAAVYGVELLNAVPEANEANGNAPSVHRVAAFTAAGNSCGFDMRVLPPGLYFYRVIAYNSSHRPIGGFSDTDTFSTVIMPGVIISQAYNNRYLASYLPIVRWDRVPGAIGYGVEILDAPPEPGEVFGTTPSVNRIAAVSGGHGSMELDLRGYKPGVYYYRVIAWDAGDNFIFGFSGYDSFTIPLNLDRPMEVQLGTSVQGRPIMATRFGQGTKKVLMVAGHHGDEDRSIALMIGLRISLYLRPEWIPANTEVWVVRCLNPDAQAAYTRWNANGVNLNRNYPTNDWGTIGVSSLFKQPKQGINVSGTPYTYDYPGPYPFSEPESRAVLELCERYGIDTLASYHEWEGCVYSGEIGWGLAATTAAQSGLPFPGQIRVSGDTTRWFNQTYGGPAITVELPSSFMFESDATVLSQMWPGLVTVMNY